MGASWTGFAGNIAAVELTTCRAGQAVASGSGAGLAGRAGGTGSGSSRGKGVGGAGSAGSGWGDDLEACGALDAGSGCGRAGGTSLTVGADIFIGE